MMKKQVLLALLATLAAYVSCTEVIPVEPAELEYGEPTTDVEGPEQVMYSYEEVDLKDEFLGLVRSNTLLFRGQFQRGAVANTVLVHRVTYTGRASTRISSVRGAQVGANLGAMAVVTSGGVGFNRATVEIRSQRGRGYNVLLEISGRY